MNLILTGMPGAGKSTLGVLLAKALGMDYIDTDLLIQKSEGRLLQAIIDQDGLDRFLEIEEKILIGLQPINSVIATGGSAVYSDVAMQHLRRTGSVIYLRLDLSELECRLRNIQTRGIAKRPGQSLAELYAERSPLYERYADVIADCTGRDIEACIQAIISRLSRPSNGSPRGGSCR